MHIWRTRSSVRNFSICSTLLLRIRGEEIPGLQTFCLEQLTFSRRDLHEFALPVSGCLGGWVLSLVPTPSDLLSCWPPQGSHCPKLHALTPEIPVTPYLLDLCMVFAAKHPLKSLMCILWDSFLKSIFAFCQTLLKSSLKERTKRVPRFQVH